MNRTTTRGNIDEGISFKTSVLALCQAHKKAMADCIIKFVNKILFEAGFH